MAYINVDEVYILDNTGLQVDKTTDLPFKNASLSETEKAQARANIGAGGSNRNLLDNPWFTVNQRGFTSGIPSAGYSTFDRWKVLGGTATYTKRSPYGITINCSSDYAYDQIVAVEKAVILGKTVTISVMIDGVVYSGTGVATNESYSVTVDAGIVKIRLGIFNAINTTYPFFRISGNSPWGTENIDAVKLELGSVSTLANDVPPNYAEELLKCEYRCVVYDLPTNTLLCRGIATSTTNIAGVIDLPRDMAEDKTPTVSLTGSVTTPAGNTITSITAATYARKNKLRVNFTGTGFTSGTVYDIFTGSASPTITISADL